MLHTEIEEAQRNGRAHSHLLENGIFYCGDTYVPPTPGQLYGHLEPIELPSFEDPAWPLPDMHCSEAFRANSTLISKELPRLELVVAWATCNGFYQCMSW